jgi:hypothetical protein
VLRSSRFLSRLMMTGILAGVCLWLAAGRGGLAQNAKDAPPPPPVLGDAPGRIDAGAKDVPPPSPARDSRSDEPALADNLAPAAPLPAAPQFPGADVPREPVESRPADLAPRSTALPEPIATDDPEKTATAFVEQNRKLAEAQLKMLKDEAERLRTRLRKVDSGVKRWEALLVALRQSESTAASEPQQTRVANPPPIETNPFAPSIEASAVTVKSAPKESLEREPARAPRLDGKSASPLEDDPKPR